ncbi:MAG: hypothetical protein ACOX9C_11210 [Kiritimatiellia bacterium]|jgi:hypothetical protein
MKTPSKPQKTPEIHRLRVTCVSGPWLDDECVRYIDIPPMANLYDLHVAIQDAVRFDDEFKFHYFVAASLKGSRTLVPDVDPTTFDPDEVDTDVYEDILVLDHIKAGAKKALFYVFLSELDDWVFKIQHTGEVHPRIEGEFYPLVVDSLSIGPDPEQYGSGFDDYAETEEHFQPVGFRGGDADYDPDAEQDDDDFFGFNDDDDDDDGFGFNDDDDDFFDDFE